MPREQKERTTTDNEYLVLRALLSGHLYGYAIRKEILEMTAGERKLSLATLYDLLHKLLEDRLISRGEDQIVEGRARRTYKITGLGERAVSEKERLMRRLLKLTGKLAAEGFNRVSNN